MKQLSKLFLIIFLTSGICSCACAQQFLQITDTTIVDTSKKMPDPTPDAWQRDLKILFDKYGFLKLQTAAPPVNGKLFKTETQVGFVINQNDPTILFIHGYVRFLNDLIGKGFGFYGSNTPFGDVIRGKIVPVGSHTIPYNSPYIRYTGTWLGGTGCNCKYSNQTDAYAEVIFSGTGVRVYGEKMKTHGKAKITLDGGSVDIDQYQDRAGSPVELLWEASGLEDKQHILRISPTGQKNPAATNTWLVIKKIEVDNTPQVDIQIVERIDTVYVPQIVRDTIHIPVMQPPPGWKVDGVMLKKE